MVDICTNVQYHESMNRELPTHLESLLVPASPGLAPARIGMPSKVIAVAASRCRECDVVLAREGGCSFCPGCGWSSCSG